VTRRRSREVSTAVHQAPPYRKEGEGECSSQRCAASLSLCGSWGCCVVGEEVEPTSATESRRKSKPLNEGRKMAFCAGVLVAARKAVVADALQVQIGRMWLRLYSVAAMRQVTLNAL